MFNINQKHEERRAQCLTGNEQVVLFAGKQVLMGTDHGVGRLPRVSEVRSLLSGEAMLMRVGTIDGVECWSGALTAAEQSLPPDLVMMECRTAFLQPTADIMNAISRGRMFVLWRAQHRLCGGCGETLAFADKDLALVCPKCGAHYYPQLSPAVIVAITRNGGKELLLAHNRRFTSRTFGLIAGFVEAGESVEQAVSREIMEETGLTVKNIQYLASQPWPFPNSLMLGFTAEYDSGEARADGDELTELGWFSRDNLPEIPAPGSIAHDLIRRLMRLEY